MPRKKRTVKGGFVDTNDIKVEGGNNYVNWINPTQIKLKQREIFLFSRKIEAIGQIVNIELDKIGKQYGIDFLFKIKQERIEKWLEYLFEPINTWNGVNTNRIRRSITHFADYFDDGKNWWDQTKLVIYRQNIFPDTFEMIYNCIYNGIIRNNNNNNNNNNNSNYNKIIFDFTLLSILKQIFNATVSYPATKALPLIPAGCVKAVRKTNKIHQFFYNKVNKSFNTEFWENKGIYKNKRAGILKAIQHKLCELTNNTQQLLIKYMGQRNNIIIQKPFLSSSNVLIIPRTISPNITEYTIKCPSNNFSAQIIVNHDLINNHNNNNNNINNYQHIHTNYIPSFSSCTVSSDFRWNPFKHCHTNNRL